MKITFEFDENNRVVKETTAETIDEVIDEIVDLLVAFGFTSETVKNGVLAKAEEIQEGNEKCRLNSSKSNGILESILQNIM